ncbi:MAG: RNA degradosome polyphosphate kinase [Acidimicrobiales bacterium]|nr:RNA degradosome polyphosphate kinase [Acidimicrobiales bacterium]
MALVEAEDTARFFNRELSWLQFNTRVLELGEDADQPLLERAKYLAIFSQNLDEFFQVRVAGLKEQVAAGITKRTPDGRSPAQQLLEIRESVEALIVRQERTFIEEMVPELAAAGIVFSEYHDLDEDDRKFLDEEFEHRIFPVLTPLAVDPGHPFPYISDLSLNLAVVVRNPDTDEVLFARVKVPSLLPRFVVLPDGERFVPLEQVIAAHLGQLFPGMVVDEHVPFRVTRNADLTLDEDEAEDLLSAVEVELRRRRFGAAVRLEVDLTMSESIRSLLVRELELTDDDVYPHAGPLGLGGLWSLHELARPDLKDPAWAPVTEPRLTDTDDEPLDIFAELGKGPVLVHHPYSSFAASVEEFVRQAAIDPKVLAIKLTLYRTSGDSPIIGSLIRAAERGKQVAVLIELKARFDEQANIEWARRLEQAGVHVAYGFAGLKIHTKTVLVVRNESDRIRRYCHIGTGNYNPKTARLYEDLGLLSADDDLGADLTQLFNFLTGYAREVSYRRLLVAPHRLRDRIVELIRGEVAAGPERGRIRMKMNSLVDATMIEELYAAGAAGIPIDLIIRGICCLRPGVPGLSEHISVRSIVGRYLEHSRIFHFANGAGPGRDAYFIGSADLMPRNLDRRVEALVGIDDPDLQGRLAEVIEINLADDQHSWELGPDGEWSRTKGPLGRNAHLELQQLALERSARPVRAG